MDMDAVHDFRMASMSTDFRELAGMAKRHCVDLPLSGRQDARLESLRRRLMRQLGGVDMAADAVTYIGPQPAAPPSPLSSISTSSSDVAEEDASPVERPAASQRPAPRVYEDDAAMPHAAHDACSFSCCSVPECSSQCTAASQPLRCMQCPVLLQRLHAAEAEATRLRAALVETQSVSLVLQVTPPHSSSDPVAQPQVEAPPTVQPPPAVPAERQLSQAAAVPLAAGRQQPAPPRRQPEQPAQPCSEEWVFQGLSFARGSDSATAHAAVLECCNQLGISEAAQRTSIVRVSRHSNGLAVVRLSDGSTVRELCRSKAQLPLDCGISIYRSLPQQQRSAAAQQRQRRQPSPAVATEAAAAARSAAADALSFAERCLSAGRRSSGGAARCPAPTPAPLGVPSRFSVLTVESSSDLSADSAAFIPPSPPTAAPAAAAGSTPSPTQAAAC